ncbi:MAG: endonuclease III [candidate division Zixibacteria bacterium]|nr:endonuclease III [candidate division Zixibacteria bacterium]
MGEAVKASLCDTENYFLLMTKKIKRLFYLLEKEYGNKAWRVHGDPLSVLMGTILSQNTSDNNSHKAFANLRSKFKNWDEVRKARVKKIANTIRSGGLADIKALRIKNILNQIYKENGSLNLSFLKRWRTDQIKTWLRIFKGVGDKTTACVLLFSLKRPAMPVDTHVLRVSKRLGLVPQNSTAIQTESLLEKLIPGNLIYQLHLNLITHGRMVCKTTNPLCQDCVLLEDCDYGKKFR